MIYDLDSLLGIEREKSVKWRFLARGFSLRRLPEEYAWEIAVFAATPGLSPWAISRFMLWPWPGWWGKVIEPICAQFCVLEAAEANARSIGERDGLDMLHALVRAGRGLVSESEKAVLPKAAAMWLRVAEERGMTAREIGDELGVKAAVVARLRSGGGLDRAWYR